MDYDVDWLLDCEPRIAQLEALSRSYTGVKYRDHKDDEASPVALPHVGGPARGWGHFMQMRVGKTPTALAEYELFARDHGFNRLLVVAPNKFKATWATEAEKFGSTCAPFVFESSKRKAFGEVLNAPNDTLVAVNYEALKSSATRAALSEYINSKTMIVADESVMIKNPKSATFKHLMTLAKNAGVTRALTGLPAPQEPSDLWAQLRFCRQLEGFQFYPFKYKFTVMGGFQGRQALGTRNEDELNELLERMTFRGRRADWSTKLESDYEQCRLDMTDWQKQIYHQMDEDFMVWLNDKEAITADMVITKRMKLQQIASGFIIDEEGRVNRVEQFRDTPKFLDLVWRLENQIAGKTIIMAHYNETINSLIEALEKYNPAVIAGTRAMKARGIEPESEKARFNEDPNCRIMIGQSAAIKYGHTLMGTAEHPCHTTVFFENSYSLDTRSQCEERNQGSGQTAPIHIIDYFGSKIERDIVRALQKKQSVADAIMTYRQAA